MTTQTTDNSVRTSIVVDASRERAFDVFTREMASWWPPEHHILDGEHAEMVVEPQAGGRMYDRGVDGSECDWARVLAYDPPDRFAFSWNINLDWKLETDLAKASEVEVRFIEQGPEQTRVELEHRNLDRHGDGWEAMRDAVGSPDGWNVGLRAFAAYAAKAA